MSIKLLDLVDRLDTVDTLVKCQPALCPRAQNRRPARGQPKKKGRILADPAFVALIAPRSNFLEFALYGLFSVGRPFGRAVLGTRSIAGLWAGAVAGATG